MILVTGGTGLIGSHLLLFLARKGYPIRAIYRDEKSLSKTRNIFQSYSSEAESLFNSIDWKQADITDITSLEPVFEGIDKIYHIAGKVSFQSRDKDVLHQTNIDGTSNMVNLALDKKIQKFLFVSSVAALGSYEQPVTEKTHWNWKENHSEYAVTKYLAEMEVWRASQEGLPVVIINPSIVLGSGFWHEGIGKLFERVYRGSWFYPSGAMGFVDVWDVVKAMHLLMESDVINDSFIVSGYNLTYRRLMQEIARSLNVSPPRYKLPKIIPETVWRLFKILPWRSKGFLTKNTVHTLYNKTGYSSEKMIKKFNFQFIPFEASIANMATQFLKSKK